MNERSGLFDGISIVFLGATVFVCLCSLLLYLRVVAPPAGFVPRTPTLPVLAIMPSDTPTPTPSFTFTPSRTFTATATPTLTATPTSTPTQTLTPSQTFTATITLTPSETPPPTTTPLPEATATLPPTPTLPEPPTPTFPPATPTPDYVFQVDPNMPQFVQYVAGGAPDCNFQGVGGLVFDQQFNRLPPSLGIQAFVTSDNGFSQAAAIESDPTWGWLVRVDNKTSAQTYRVELRSSTGAVLSPPVRVSFPNDCARNLGLVNFVQNRPF